jgi:asparagine synthetase B (glutamine-hydrolysing)
MRWAEWGPFRCFFHGLLFDRGDLAQWSNCGQLDYSNADLILRAYERGGEATLQRLRGSFVVAIIDRARDTAIVARDPLGSNPLFYVETGSQVLFAVTPQPLLEYPGVSRSLNRVALADHLCNRWPDPQETFFAAIRRLPPGWRVIISGGRLHPARYWDPWPEDRPIEWLTNEEAAKFDDVFDRTVGRCLGHGPTGIFLSGGLDSISVASVAADRARHIGSDPPLALSLGFAHPSCDERERQAAVARDLGLPQVMVDFNDAVGSSPLLQQSLELNKVLAAPILNTWMPAYLELARRGQSAGVQTILTGLGGDEWLGLSPYLVADLMRRGAVGDVIQFLCTLWRSHTRPPVALARHALWQCGVRPLVGLVLHRLMPKLLNAWRLKRQVSGDPLWLAPDPELRSMQRHRAQSTLPSLDPPQGFYFREERSVLDHSFSSWELEEQYQFGKTVGVRFLNPFWDPDLLEMLYRTPPRILNGGGRTKGLVRGTFARRFPALGLERQRKVLGTSFLSSLLRREGRALADVAGDFPALSNLGIVNGKATQAFVRETLGQPDQRIQRCWIPINLELWSRSHCG